ncbi:MAG: hypothetical protein BBJ57_00560 [Desulfobacterales bacterium PC51MH44]|nr:MAG: hypothetical protein BBJ57_00560 [Desulfobacterales bacterium PC51MH44]
MNLSYKRFSYIKLFEKAARDSKDLSEEQFYPLVPENLNQTGLNEKLIEDLILKLLLSLGVMIGRQIADEICLPFKAIEQILSDLRKQLFLTYRSDAGINDFEYMLTEQGRTKALIAAESTAYVGSAPVPYTEYLQSIESQSIQKENPGSEELQRAFHDLVLEPHIFYTLGPAIN